MNGVGFYYNKPTPNLFFEIIIGQETHELLLEYY